MERIRGSLTASAPGQNDGNQHMSSQEVKVSKETEAKGTAMKKAELQLARDRISREKSFIRETSQVYPCSRFFSKEGCV